MKRLTRARRVRDPGADSDYHARTPSVMIAMPTPPPYLDDDQIERLSDLLDRRAVPFKGFNLEALDGFLSALVVSTSKEITAAVAR